MNFTIKDILPLFQEHSVCLAAGSAGLDNAILSVNIMDAPDIANWVKPGDLILTTAYTMKDDPVLQERVVRELVASGAAGLGIKTKRFLPEIPSIMKDVADELNFPILELPLNLTLLEILSPIISSIAERQTYLLQRSNEIHNALTKAAIQGGGLSSIIACLGALTHSPVGCFDTNGSPLCHWLPENIPGVAPEVLGWFKALLSSRDLDNDHLQMVLSQTKAPCTRSLDLMGETYVMTSAAIMSNNEFFGYITIIQLSDAFSNINCMALEHTATVATLDFLKQKAVAESRRLRSRDMLEHILFGDLVSPNSAEVLSGLNLMQAKRFQCLVIELDDSEQSLNIPVILNRIYKTTQQIVLGRYPASLVSERAGKVIVLLASTSTDLQEADLCAQLHNSFTEKLDNLKISLGVGTMTHDLKAIARSYQDALTCLHLGRVIKGPGSITLPHEVASYSLLGDSPSASLLDHAYGSILQKLEASDKTSGGELLKTLDCYLECEKNQIETAKTLYIHRNTLANRLQKIADLTGLDLDDSELLFGLRLALRRRKMGV